MYAKTADELREMLSKHPESSPSSFLSDSSLAASCYDKKRIRDLKSAFNRDADPEECIKWRISPSEWKENVEMAMIALIAAEKQKLL